MLVFIGLIMLPAFCHPANHKWSIILHCKKWICLLLLLQKWLPPLSNPSCETVPLIAGTYFAICPALRSRTLDQTQSACQIRTMTPMQASFFLQKLPYFPQLCKKLSNFLIIVLLIQKFPYCTVLASSFCKILAIFSTFCFICPEASLLHCSCFFFLQNTCPFLATCFIWSEASLLYSSCPFCKKLAIFLNNCVFVQKLPYFTHPAFPFCKMLAIFYTNCFC